MPRTFKWEDLVDRSSVHEKTILLNGTEIQSGVNFLEEVVAVWQTAENFCDWGMEAVWEPSGR
jgi:hypothetical protein